MHDQSSRSGAFPAVKTCHWRGLKGPYLTLVLLCLLVSGCSRPTVLERIQQEQVLHVITRDAPAIYYQDQDGPGGVEYELAKRFADHLGVELRLQVADNLGEIFSILDQDYTHFAAAGLSVTESRRQRFRFSPPYMQARPLVIFRRGVDRPLEPADLEGLKLVVLANSSHEQRLVRLAKLHPGISWTARADIDSLGLLAAVNEGEFDAAVLDSNELAMNHVFFPDVLKGFPLAAKVDFAWAFPAGADDSLLNEARSFFRDIRQNGTLAQILERHYGHLDRLNYVGARTFVHHLRRRLPTYQALFLEAAETYDVDWRLLAAIGYQESHWRPNAVSPTGVRGLMMLTQNTAEYIGVSDRLDPRQSIMGGARYFKRVLGMIPENIKEPDRTWFALASYNVGFGHLEDARILAETDGKNPDRWLDVKEYLPLLAHKEWYSKTKHGYARGYEPVVYVQNIRRYFDVLAWMEPADPSAQMVAEEEEESLEQTLELPAGETDVADLDSSPVLPLMPAAL
ncbi:membrane-bound lytic murein transglycosylase MltF [Hydrocarboniclastica marina]|uniref:Membrane-bound lytic murein transglycosylase F n=1 Tax=Hydrocarboniclastica marina TaxID=2259620 RepID=A0A4V1D8K9_9ALTE|nr:membrane-bound lytic murein transglycosylase MltF [Hydrocarboniclastica marina]QCF25550.1 membrane-bound lytic murein transglycosylase MltF [Hydrocarboniclastica marina]